MIRLFAARFTLLTLTVAACSSNREPASSESASVAQAQAKAEDLANSTQNYQPIRFVSELEQSTVPRPVTRREVDDVVKEGADSVIAETVVEPEPMTTQHEPDVAADSTPVEASAPRVPMIVPREAPLPEAVVTNGSGAGNWRGVDPGPDMGTVIGVVLRGGRVDPGHCPRHPPHPGQLPNRIPRQNR